ncbi:FtsX-like permease family protein [Murimonas intestini]|uniref:FtsX-like permease family protein n=1 Tax=Murimonas intestini TaxID=1337051 RepID=UPI0011DDDD1E|nr:FtsX-like permease family protein [Murimonas intestini]
MLSKLALRNVKRSMKDYSVYMITVTIAFSLMYAFNMVVFSDDIQGLNQTLSSLSIVIVMISLIVIFVIAWLVHYMNRFMLEKRSRELGTYMLLGITNKKIARMFMTENVIMGAAAALAGFLAGSMIYQVLTLIIMNLFEVAYTVHASFSLPAVLLTLLYVFIIYAFSMLRTGRKLKKIKICDLLYAEKRNENAVLSSKKSHWILFVVSFLLLGTGCGLLYTIFHNIALFSGEILFLGLALLIGGLYGSYITLAGFLVKIFLGKNEKKFQKDNMFIYRNLSAKLRTMSFTIGTLAMLLTLTLACTQNAMLFNKFFELQSLNRCAFDIQVTAPDPALLSPAAEHFRNTGAIKEERMVTIYDCKQSSVYDRFGIPNYIERDYAISFSDYAALRQMLGYEPVKLQDGHYIIHGSSQYKDTAKRMEELPLSLNGVTLSLQAAFDEPLSQSGVIGVGYILVLPDEQAEELSAVQTSFVMTSTRQTGEEDFNYLCSTYEQDDDSDTVSYVGWNVKSRVIDDSRASIIIFAFGLYYTGLIFICTAAAILAVQQLSEASKYRFRYNILSKLGVTDGKIGKIILKQLLLYFGIPLLLPVPLSLFISSCIKNILLEIITPSIFWSSMATGLGLFFIIYLLYFAATYIGYRRSILG